MNATPPESRTLAHNRQRVLPINHRLVLASMMLLQRDHQKIVLQSQLADLGLHVLDARSRLLGTLGGGLEHILGVRLQLRLPLRDLIGVQIELLRQLGQRLIAAQAIATFALNAAVWFLRGLFIVCCSWGALRRPRLEPSSTDQTVRFAEAGSVPAP